MTEVDASTAGKEPIVGGNVGMGTQYLEVRGLTVDFDGFKAVSDVDLTLFQGDLRFLIGPNGAGKTTVIDAITGLVPASGSINKSGVELLGKKVHQIARSGVGRTFQTASVFEQLTVLQNLDIAAGAGRSAWTLLRRRSSVHGERPAPAAISRFCSTVSCSKTLAVWKVRPTPRRAIWCTFLPNSSTPDLLTDPVALTSPVIASMTVVFPAPLGPIRNRRSPWNSVRSTSLTALNPSKSTVRPRTSRYSLPMPTLPPATGSASGVVMPAPPLSPRPAHCRDRRPVQVRQLRAACCVANV